MFLVEGKSQRQIAQTLGISRIPLLSTAMAISIPAFVPTITV